MRKHAGEAARLMKAIGNENRLMVLCALGEGELSVGELLKRVDLSQSALSQHLAVLRREALVSTRRESQSIYYSLASSNARLFIDFLYKTYCA
jgi:DNA-binding transcriptional ArsR family regulator